MSRCMSVCVAGRGLLNTIWNGSISKLNGCTLSASLHNVINGRLEQMVVHSTSSNTYSLTLSVEMPKL